MSEDAAPMLTDEDLDYLEAHAVGGDGALLVAEVRRLRNLVEAISDNLAMAERTGDTRFVEAARRQIKAARSARRPRSERG